MDEIINQLNAELEKHVEKRKEFSPHSEEYKNYLKREIELEKKKLKLLEEVERNIMKLSIEEKFGK